jgi:Uma2 family endonuclease
MTSAANISIEQYLQTSYRPDREYVDGELRERNLGLSPHVAPRLVAGWFGSHEQMWSVVGLIGPRVEVSPLRIRVPDYALLTSWPQPDVIVDPPLLIIEIISPEDTYSHTQERIQDYLDMGVETVWIVDPWTCTGRVCDSSNRRECNRLEVEDK